MLFPTQQGSSPSSLLPMQTLLIVGNQFGQAVGSRWRGLILLVCFPAPCWLEGWWLWGQGSLPAWPKQSWGQWPGLAPGLVLPLLHASSPQLLLQCSPHLCSPPLAPLGSAQRLLLPQLPPSCLFPSCSSGAESTCLHCCPSFHPPLIPLPSCFLPLGFQALSSVISAGEAPERQTASGLSLHSWTPVSHWRTPARQPWRSPDSPRSQKMSTARGMF